METGSEVYMSELLVIIRVFHFFRLDLIWMTLMKQKNRTRKICWNLGMKMVKSI